MGVGAENPPERCGERRTINVSSVPRTAADNVDDKDTSRAKHHVSRRRGGTHAARQHHSPRTPTRTPMCRRGVLLFFLPGIHIAAPLVKGRAVQAPMRLLCCGLSCCMQMVVNLRKRSYLA